MSTETLSPELWAEVKQVFLQAVMVAPAARAAWLDAACSGRPDLRSHVAALLQSEVEADGLVGEIHSALGIPIEHDHEPPPAPAIPESIGSCRVLNLLGEGATGLVYLGEQSRPRRQVAIKVLRPGHTSPSSLRRLEREAEIMARMRHVGIAQVYESGIEAAGPYVMMEYIEGQPITRFARSRTLSVNERIHLFLRVCDAVQHAHAMGVIHRDLKPANILVTDAGVPKVLDFGVARAVEIDAAGFTLGGTLHQLVGTLAYMSPEQALGTSDVVDTRADVYALGSILYELFAGRLPLEVGGKSLGAALRQIQERTPARLGTIARTYRGDLETIVAKALEKDPARRYASVSELASDLRRHLEHLPIHARPPSAVYEAARFTRRHRPLVAGSAIALVSVLGMLTWLFVTRQREHQDYLLAKGLAGSWLAEVMHDLAPVPGSYAMRVRMLTELREPLRRFAERHPHDLDAISNLAAWCGAYAGVCAERGDMESALEYYLQTNNLLADLLGRGPDPRLQDWRLRRSIAAVRVGDILFARSEYDEARRWHETALELDTLSVAHDRENYTALDQLVWSYHRLANADMDHGRMKTAELYEQQLWDAAHSLAKQFPDSAKALYCRVGALSTRSHLLHAKGDLAGAARVRDEVISESQRLIRMEQNNKGYILHLIHTLAAQADARARLGEPDEAEKCALECVRLADSLLMRAPDDLETIKTAILSQQAVAVMHHRLGRPAEAIEARRRAVEHAHTCLAMQPGSLAAVENYASQLVFLADTMASLGTAEEREFAFDVAQSELVSLTHEQPTSIRTPLLLGHLRTLGVLHALSTPEQVTEAVLIAAARCTPRDIERILDCAFILRSVESNDEARTVLELLRKTPPNFLAAQPASLVQRVHDALEWLGAGSQQGTSTPPTP